MNTRILGIIGGLALVLALLSPYVLGNSKRVAELFEAAETLYDSGAYEAAIGKYEDVLMESNKLFARTETIDKDFKTLVIFKIAMSYVKLAEQFNDAKHYYEKALIHIERGVLTVTLVEYKENLTYLWGYSLYKIGHLVQAKEKFTELIKNFPNSRFREKTQETVTQINKQLQKSEEQNAEEEKTDEVVTPTDIIPIWVNDPSKFEAFNKKQDKTLFVPNQLRAEEQYVKAAKQYEAFAKTNPPSTETAYALYWSGWCYYEAAASDDETLLRKSLDIFQRLVNNYSNSPYTHEACVKLPEIKNLILKHESKAAIIATKETVGRAQQSNCKSDLIPKAMIDLGNAKQKYEQGNYAAALTLANEIQAIAQRTLDKHETASRYVNQGYTYLNQGQLETATQKARDALRIDPPYQNANNLLEDIKQRYFNQGINYINGKEYTKAILSLKKAMNMGLRSKEMYVNLGRAYVKLGKFEEGKDAADAALAIDPTCIDARHLRDSIAD